jgi:competence transcription factor ComK
MCVGILGASTQFSNNQTMQGKAGEVTLAVTSHNQKQQHTQCKRQTQTAANRPQEGVHTEPKTTTNKKQKLFSTTLFEYCFHCVSGVSSYTPIAY